MKTHNLVKLSLLTAIALTVFVIETRIPNLIPIPGIKLGLANIVTVWALYTCKPQETALMLLARIALGAIFCGTALTFIYSICGASLCLAVCIAAKKLIPANKLWLTSIIGAIFHNIGQIIAAALILSTSAIFVYVPVLMLSAIITGLFCGVCAQFIYIRLQALH